MIVVPILIVIFLLLLLVFRLCLVIHADLSEIRDDIEKLKITPTVAPAKHVDGERGMVQSLFDRLDDYSRFSSGTKRG